MDLSVVIRENSASYKNNFGDEYGIYRIKNKSERYNKSVKHTMKTFQIIKRAMSTEVIGNFQKTL